MSSSAKIFDYENISKDDNDILYQKYGEWILKKSDPKEFYDMMIKSDRNFMETLKSNRAIKFYADVDEINESNEMTDFEICADLKKVLSTQFKKHFNIFVFPQFFNVYCNSGIDKNGKHKRSFHIILNNHAFNRCDINKMIRYIELDSSKYVKFDHNVYAEDGKRQNFTFLYNGKNSDKRKFSILKADNSVDSEMTYEKFYESLISVYNSNTRIHEVVDYNTELPNFVSKKNDDFDNKQIPVEITDELKNKLESVIPEGYFIDGNHYQHIKLSRTEDTICPIHDRIHESKGNNAFIVKKDYLYKFHCMNKDEADQDSIILLNEIDEIFADAEESVNDSKEEKVNDFRPDGKSYKSLESLLDKIQIFSSHDSAKKFYTELISKYVRINIHDNMIVFKHHHRLIQATFNKHHCDMFNMKYVISKLEKDDNDEIKIDTSVEDEKIKSCTIAIEKYRMDMQEIEKEANDKITEIKLAIQNSKNSASTKEEKAAHRTFNVEKLAMITTIKSEMKTQLADIKFKVKEFEKTCSRYNSRKDKKLKVIDDLIDNENDDKTKIHNLYLNDIKTANKLSFLKCVSAINFVEEDTINTFTGFKGKLIKDYDISKIEYILHFIKNVVCNESDEWFNFFMIWLSNSYFGSNIATGIMPIIVSRDGNTGKSFFQRMLKFHLFKEENSVSLTNFQNIEKWNDPLSNGLFISFDELTPHYSLSDQLVSELKSMMTSDQILIRKRNTNDYHIKNDHIFFGMGNDENLFPNVQGNSLMRRFVIMPLGLYGLSQTKEDYFDVIEKEFKNNIDHFVTYLKTFHNPNQILCKIIPENHIRQRQANYLDVVDRFVVSIISGEINCGDSVKVFDDHIHINKIAILYKKFMDQQNEKAKRSKTILVNELIDRYQAVEKRFLNKRYVVIHVDKLKHLNNGEITVSNEFDMQF